MNNKFDELAKGLAQSVTRRQALKRFGVGLAGIALACFGLFGIARGQTSVISDAAGDAAFPLELYNGPVPLYLDIVQASVSLKEGTFHFEIQVNAQIPSNPSPGLVPAVNHLGVSVAILTTKTSGSVGKFFGQTDTYHFNFLIGALYSFADSGVGLGLGWQGFLIDLSTFTLVEIPIEIRGDTLVYETTAESLGSPQSFSWVVASECDPVPVPEEQRRSVIVPDFAPDHGYAAWPQ